MKRDFDFSQKVKDDAFFRQWNLCAHCGMSLVDVMDNAHHVVPNQVGKASNPDHSWIQGVDNCVVLCESCHYAAHEYGRYRAGAVPAPDFYPYSHGRETDKHRAWLGVMMPRFWSKW